MAKNQGTPNEMKIFDGIFLLFSVLAVLFNNCDNAHALNPEEILENSSLEKRARDISKHLRCVVCQNQSIDDSDAPLARDFRLLVRERLKAGDTNQQVINYLVSRYGDFILLNPPVKKKTVILWLGPLIFISIGFLWLVFYFRRQSSQPGGRE